MVEHARQDKIEFVPFPNLRKLAKYMARPRHQKGWLKLDQRGQWVAHWYAYVRLEDGSEVRRRRKRIIGDRKLKRWQAEEKLAALVTGDPSTLSARPDPRVTLEWF